jgi:hypothetical protein
VDGKMPNPNTKDLGVRAPYQQFLGGNKAFIGHLEGSGVNIDRDNFAMVAVFDLRSDLRLVQRMAALSKFFFAISGLSDCHGADLTATSVIPF